VRSTGLERAARGRRGAPFVVEGKREECLAMTDRALAAWSDPEGRYNLAVNLVAMREADRAVNVLTQGGRAAIRMIRD